MIKQNFAGIKTFFYLYIKRDRWLFPFWTLLPVGVLVGHALTFVSLTQNKNLTSVIHEFNRDDLVSAVHGPIMSVDLVGATLWRSISFITLLMGIGAILTVIRHSRTDEEEGRAELFYSLVVGKYASITAALFTAILGVSLSSLLLSIGMTLLDGSFQEVLVFYLTLFLSLIHI